MFMRYGAKSVTMDDIARQMGISKKTLYQFVSNKAELVEKICHRHIEEEKEAIDLITKNSGNAIEEMLNIAQYITALLREMSPKALYDLQKYYRKSWALMESLHKEHVYQVIFNNLKRGIAEGLYRETLNADIIAKLYVGKSLLVVDEDMFPLNDYKKDTLFTEFINYHIRGIASSKGLKALAKHTK